MIHGYVQGAHDWHERERKCVHGVAAATFISEPSFRCTRKFFENKSFYILSIKYKLTKKLIADSVRKSRDESNEPK